MVACIVLYAVTFAVILPRYADGRSSASIVRDWQRASAAQPGALVFVNQQLPHSAKFYSRATARALDGEHAAALIDGPVVYFVFGKGAKDYDGAKLPPEFAGRVDLVSQQERYALYRTAGPH